MLILYRKDEVVRQFLLRGCRDAASLQTLFELFRDDSAAESSKESAAVRKNALRSILDEALKNLTVERLGYNYPSYGVERERSLADFGRVFQTVADFCYTIEQRDLVRQALRIIMQDTKWTSSTELVRIVAYQVARDSEEGGNKLGSCGTSP